MITQYRLSKSIWTLTVSPHNDNITLSKHWYGHLTFEKCSYTSTTTNTTTTIANIILLCEQRGMKKGSSYIIEKPLGKA